MLDKLAEYRKAIVGLLGPAVTVLLWAIQDGSLGGVAITREEWIAAGIAALLTGGTVAAVPNKSRRARKVPPPKLPDVLS